jgi:hypothetical protein
MVQAINIHGAFLESWCRNVEGRVQGWSLAYYNYPVEWPEFNGYVRGQESSLDLRADSQQDLSRVSLLIECKRANPELTDWVFFRKRGVYEATPSLVYQLDFSVDAAGRVTVREALLRGFPWKSVVAEDGRETRGNYLEHKAKGDKTRTSSSAIHDAARQVSLAYRSITQEETRTAPRQINEASLPHYPRRHIFVPVIVTTARLFVCEFDPNDVDPMSGELPLDKATLSEVTHLRYEYALPPALQWPADPAAQKDNPDWREASIRQWIAIINAAHFEQFLQHYATHLKDGVHMAPFPDAP